MVELVMFFNGPKTRWSGKVADDEIIMRSTVRWRWLAKMNANSLMNQLSRCGYVILKDGEVIDEVLPE